MRKYRVAIWGTGMVGQYAIRFVLANPHLELVAVKCHSPDKVGKDAAELANLKRAPTGIKATDDEAAILATQADCVIYAPFDPLGDPTIPGNPSSAWVPAMLRLLSSGKNVIATMITIAHWRHLKNGEAFHDEINAACLKGKSSFFVTGIDPGFTPDAAAFALSALVGEISQINTWEILDYGSYPGLALMTAMGFGLEPEKLSASGMENIRIGWGGCPHLLADAFGVTLDGVRVEGDFSLAKETYTCASGYEIRKGTIEGMKFRVIGSVAGQDRFIVNHVTRMGQQAAPHWRRIGQDGGYGIEVEGFPPFRGEFPFGWPGGTGASWSDAMVMTSARCVNSIEPVVLATPGYKTFLDLAPLGARYALNRPIESAS